MTPNFSRNYKKTFGNLEQSLVGNKIRLLAFWDKDSKTETLVIATHGFIKKVDKVPANEIERAVNIRNKFIESKEKK